MERSEDKKAKARDFERRGAHDSALQIYLQLAEAATPVPACLRVQIGNLQRQLNQGDSAIESYSYAVSTFAEAGQLNNAIAANQLLLELAPDSPDHHRRLGEFSISQGYREFARSGISTYARLMSLAGNPGGAAASVASFLERYPDDDGVWRGWIDELLDRGSEDQAVEAMEGLHAALEGAGASALAGRIQSEIDTLRPRSHPPESPSATDGSRGTDLRDGPLPATEPEDESPGELPFLQFESSSYEIESISRLPGLELTHDPGWEADDDGAEVEPLQLLGSVEEELPGLSRGQQTDERLPDWSPEPETGNLPGFSTYDGLPGLEGDELVDDDQSGETDLESIYISGSDVYPPEAEAPTTTPFAESWSPEASALAPPEETLASGEGDRPGSARPERDSPEPATIDLASLVSALRELGPVTVEATEPGTHFDLGVAFKEMGLWEESVAHLANAIERGHDPLAVLEVVGEILLESGDTDLAAELLGSVPGAGLEASPGMAGIHYWMGRLAEADNPSDARRLFELVAAVQPDFMDVESRLRRLSQGAL